jgi:hypothetical protein
MARTRKAIQPLNLAKYDVLIEDRGVRSDYFKISQFDGYFYGGRNAFLVAGATVLRPGSNILVEILNSNGTTVYSAPVNSFVEGSSRLIQVEVYENTPIGPGKIILLGSTDFYTDGRPIPQEWRGKYNVRWIENVIISPRVENKTPIRFVTSPAIVVEEKFYSSPVASFEREITVPVDVTITPKYYNVFPNGYLLSLSGPDDDTRFFNKYLNGTLTGSIKLDEDGNEFANINLPITRIFNSRLAESQGKLIFTNLNNSILSGYISASGEYTTNITPFGNVNITSSLNLQYNELTTTSSAYLISFAKIRLVNLSTVSGEIHKIKLSYKPTSEPGEYVLLSDVNTFVAELFAVDSGSVPYETGYFTDKLILNDYWYAATMSVLPNQTNPNIPEYYFTSSVIEEPTQLQQCCTELLDAIRFDVPISSSGTTFDENVSYFIGNKENNKIALFPRSEYTISFDALVAKTSGSYVLDQPNYSMEVYLVASSGSNQNILETNRLGQLIGTLTPTSTFQKQNFERVEFNFVPKIRTSGVFDIRFVIYGGFWDVANISVKTAQEPFFSPDEFDILIPQVNYADSLLEFKAEYVDINNNSIGVNTISLPTYFTGSLRNQQINIFFDNGIV